MIVYTNYSKNSTYLNVSFIFIFKIFLLTIILHSGVFSQNTNPDPVPLLTAETYGALAYSGITGDANVNGDVGTSTASIDGTIRASGTNWGVGDPHTLQAQIDLAAALTDAGNRASDLTISDALGGQTLTRGVYDGGALDLASGQTLTLTGTATDVFIIRAASTLTINVGGTVALGGSAVWSNVFWYVGSSATIYSGTTFNGIILAETSITLNASATLVNAKFLAHGGAVTINSDVLPVELTSFTAEVNNGSTLLNWQTATEVNNYGFEIERSVVVENAVKEVSAPLSMYWEKVAFIEGHGNSNSPKLYSFTDKNLIGGNKFVYRLKQIDIDGTFEFSDEVEIEVLLTKYELMQNYPNPFNPTTKIRFSLPEDAKIAINIYNVLGEKVTTILNDDLKAGSHQVEFKTNTAGYSLASGVYIYKIESKNFSQVKKMILMK